MKGNKYIRSFAGGFLLLVFCLGITPKQILHEVLTNHKHVPGKYHKLATIDRVATKYVCDIHDQVAESPFVETVTEEIRSAVIYTHPVSFHFREDPYSRDLLHADLRGPPVLA
ncbi:MAG: hypothetical protein ABWZ25_13355 [Chitinophagaceae bacterium]